MIAVLIKILLGIVIFCAVVFLVYCIIPNLYARNVSKNVIRTINPKNKQIALTFDDGPNEQYTKKVLNVLKENDIKVTFFSVITNANKNLDIVNEIKEDGHEIAFHSYKHQSAWELTPNKTLTEITRGENDLKASDVKFTYMRPPWGTFNMFTLMGALRKNMKVILWTVEAYDWRANNSGENIANIIESRIKPGDIIVLHDSGGADGAPLHTIDALKIFIPRLKEQGYKFVTISEGLKYD